MNDERLPRRRGNRRLTKDERELWQAAVRQVKPLRTLAPGDVDNHAAPAEALPEPAPSPHKVPGGRVAPPAKPKPAPQPLTPLAPLGRRLRQRVARGGAAIDARIDLHGMTQERAHRALVRFLRHAQADNASLVLVITGKGARGGDSVEPTRGVLRHAVPQWLALPEFRSLVVGFEAAATGHGGEGALYVRVRRAR